MGDEVAQLPCSHIFHPKCSHLWIRKHWSCPLRCDVLEQSPKLATSDGQVRASPDVSQPDAAVLAADLEMGALAADLEMDTGDSLRAIGRAATTPMESAPNRHDTEHGMPVFTLPGLNDVTMAAI